MQVFNMSTLQELIKESGGHYKDPNTGYQYQIADSGQIIYQDENGDWARWKDTGMAWDPANTSEGQGIDIEGPFGKKTLDVVSHKANEYMKNLPSQQEQPFAKFGIDPAQMMGNLYNGYRDNPMDKYKAANNQGAANLFAGPNQYQGQQPLNMQEALADRWNQTTIGKFANAMAPGGGGLSAFGQSMLPSLFRGV